MNKKTLVMLMLAFFCITLWGCANAPIKSDGPKAPTATSEQSETAAAATVPPTVPNDGNPDDVTCKGSYSRSVRASSVVATVGDAKLTNAQLAAWYWAHVAQYKLASHDIAPDFDQGLDTQVCQIDNSVNTWQQYFLNQALNAWHSAQALTLQGQADGSPTDEVYKPIVENHEKYMTGMPATKVLYGYNNPYQPNTLHQAYLDSIPEQLQTLAREKGFADADEMAATAFGTDLDALTELARLYNYGYMYFTSLSYDVESTAEDIGDYFAKNENHYAQQNITPSSGYYVNIRHLLVIPESEEHTVDIAEDGTVTFSEEAWESCRLEAEALLDSWMTGRRKSEATFADLANKNSDDTGSALNGGSYRQLQPGQLIAPLDSWCFDPDRIPGDTVILRSDYGYHILYFSGKTDIWYARAEADLTAQKQSEIIAAAKERFPMEVDYSAITLSDATAAVSAAEFLYPDIAHQRYPEVPLFLQQDYPGIKFGAHELRTHGCGITTMSMLASYMTDDEWTPPEMCERYSNYSYVNGTDGMIFSYEPAVMGFYLRANVFDYDVALEALKEGQIVVCIQHKGYWTRGGHYLLLEKLTEDGQVQVRDSNIFNYGRLVAHKEDKHTWGNVIRDCFGYWIYEDKVTMIPACTRCGNPEDTNAPLAEDYICEKCEPALIRRNAWLEHCN